MRKMEKNLVEPERGIELLWGMNYMKQTSAIKPNSEYSLLPTREGYDLWASIYDGEDNPLIALEQRHLPPLLRGIKGKKVLDVGCGTGRMAFQLVKKGAAVTGVDFSEQMLEKARSKPLAKKINFVLHDFSKGLPFPDRSFDTVTSFLVLDHVQDVDRFFAEAKRVCKPKGSIVLSVMHPAMMLLGISARFTDPASGRQIRPKSAANTIPDYVMAATSAGLTFSYMKEFQVDQALADVSPRAGKYLGWILLLLMKLTV